MNTKLQIISGKYRGKKLSFPNSARPTSQRAREGIFNVLTSKLGATKNLSVWDMFAGSGAFGIECISRDWCNKVLFNDSDHSATMSIQQNLSCIDTNAKFSVIQKNIVNTMVNTEKFDLIFIDPPYSESQLQIGLAENISNTLNDDGIVIFEVEKDEIADKIISAANLQLFADKRYGRARFLFFEKATE
jgi:16S rRNA (guanine966-N2)-methyltransferase